MPGLVRSPYPRERGALRTVLTILGWATAVAVAPWILTFPPVTYEGLGLVAGVGWGVLTGAGAALSLIGHLARRHEVELPGMILLGTGLVIYAALSWATVAEGSTGSGARALLLVAACFFIADRMLELIDWHLDLRRIDKIGRGVAT